MSDLRSTEQIDERRDELKRVMGPGLLLLFIVGDILGTGIYALTGTVAKEVGGAVWLPFLLAFVVADGFSAIVGDLDDEMLDSVLAAYGGEALTIGDRNYISVVEAGSLIFLTFYQGVRVGFELLMAGEAPTADETELLTEFVGAVAFL